MFEKNAKFKLKSNFRANIPYKEMGLFGSALRNLINGKTRVQLMQIERTLLQNAWDRRYKTYFKLEMIPVKNTIYYYNGFQFRFKNYFIKFTTSCSDILFVLLYLTGARTVLALFFLVKLKTSSIPLRKLCLSQRYKHFHQRKSQYIRLKDLLLRHKKPRLPQILHLFLCL